MQFLLDEQDRSWVKNVSLKILDKMDWVSDKNKNKLPYTTGPDGSYDDRSTAGLSTGQNCSWWTNGFWGGMMWQMYHRTLRQKYLQYAVTCEEKLDNCFTEYYGLNHDVGFLWLPTAVADYHCTHNLNARRRALHAANILAGRFNPAGNFIRAWDDIDGEDTRGWAIIDCMMNIPLLYWASVETNDPRFGQIARRHADTVCNAFVRSDGSVCHIVEFDPETGARLRSRGGQGYGHGSAWTRGQGWALYGFALSYRYTRNQDYLHTAEQVARYCLSQLGKDGFVPIDFRQPEDAPQEDNCGACVIACGMLELVGHTADIELRNRCQDAALRILRRVTTLRCDWSRSCDAIVQYCSASWENGINMTMNYADYYLMEAIFRLEGRELTIF